MPRSRDWLAMRAHHSPDQTGLIYGGQVWTFNELSMATALAAARLEQLDVQKGDRVGLVLGSHPGTVALLFAAQRIGAVPALVNPRLTSSEILDQLASIDCGLAVTENPNLPVKATDHPGISFRLLDTLDLPDSPDLLGQSVQFGKFEGLIARNDISVILFTSGSSGKPLPVGLTYENIFWSVLGSNLRLGNLPGDTWLVCLPLFHVGGVSIVFRSILNESPILLQDGFSLDEIVTGLVSHRPTLISVVPTMLHRILENWAPDFQQSSLRVVLTGGARLSLDVLEEAFDRSLPVALTYGLTEAASQVATATPSEVLQKPGSVGKGLYFNKISIHNQAGTDHLAGEVGEIVVSGPTIMQGYLTGPSAQGRKVTEQGLFTGDLGYLDEQGDLWVIGRQDGVINTGGEKVYPLEVEQALLDHPQVRLAHVVGIEDQEWGQQVAAAVVQEHAGAIREEDLIEFLKSRIGNYKVPKKVMFLDELPLNSSGKIDTFVLKRKFEALNGN